MMFFDSWCRPYKVPKTANTVFETPEKPAFWRFFSFWGFVGFQPVQGSSFFWEGRYGKKPPPLCCAPLRGRIGLRFNQQCQHTTAWWECHTTRTQPRFTRQLLREFWLRNRPLTQGPAALIAASCLVSDYRFKPLSGVL